MLSGRHFTPSGEKVERGDVWEPTAKERAQNRGRLAPVSARSKGFVAVGIDLKALERARKEKELR